MAEKNQSPIDKAFEAGEFELVSFMKGENDNGGKGSWFNFVLLDAVPRETLSRIVDDPLWDSERMKVSIYLNSERVVYADFNKIMSYFANRLAQQKLSAAHFDDFEKAVQVAAKALITRTADGVQEKFYELQTQLSQLTDLTAGMVEREYAVPFKYQTTEKMIKAGMTALGRFFDTEPEVNFDGKREEGEENAEAHGKNAVEAIYKAMVTARDEPEYKVKLPRSYQTGDEYTTHEIATRRKMLDEVEESLRQQGIVFEPMQTRFEKMGDV
jgi:hypothetical protein